MKTAAYELLEGAIDYAGLYPPAKLPLSDAVREYLEILSGDGDWLTSRFVCPASQRDEVSQSFRAAIADAEQEEEIEEDPFPLALVGSADAPDFENDANALLKSDLVYGSAYEIRLPSGESLRAALGGLKKLLRGVESAEVSVFAELAWSPNLVDEMHQVAEVSEAIGFKARTGGVVAEAFPAPSDLASFIVEAASLEVPFKFTAGLHEPIRYQDEALGVMRHGFLNVIIASALCVTQDLSVLEVQRLLEITDPSRFMPSDQGIEVDDFSLDLSDIAEFRDWFGGFGSCSIDEPFRGLHRIGWLT